MATTLFSKPQSTEINELNNKILGKGRRFITIADSYGRNPSVAQSWQTYLHSYVEADDFYDYYEGSMGISHAGENGHNAYTLLSSKENNIPNKETITDIIVGLGINDYSEGTASLDSAYNSLIQYVWDTYPNATIWFCWPGNSRSQAFSTVINQIAIMKKNALKRKCKFIDGIQYIMHNARNMISDGVHPNVNGSTEIAKGIAEGLRNGGSYRYLYYGTCKAALTGGGQKDIAVVIENETTYIWFPDLSSTSNTFTFTAGGRINVGTITDPIVYLIYEYPTVVTTIYSTTASVPICMGVYFNDTNIAVRSPVAATTNVFQINTFHMTIPTMITK